MEMKQENGKRNDIPMEELMDIVSGLAQNCLGCSHTSMTWERAQSLMEGVLYCIGQAGDRADEMPALSGGSGKELYEAGCAIVRNKADRIRLLYNQMAGDFEDYGMECLRDTIQKGIPEFLKRYDARFCPQDTILTLDYPVLSDLSGRMGADAVLEYLRCIRLEQKFLGLFGPETVRELLRRHDPEYEKGVENICGILMPCVTERALEKSMGKEQQTEEQKRYEMEKLFRDSSAGELESLACRILERLLDSCGLRTSRAEEYFGGLPKEFAVRVSHAAKNGCLERIFLWRTEETVF